MAERAGQVNGQFVRTYFKRSQGDVRGAFILDAAAAAGVKVGDASYVWTRCLLQASMQPLRNTGSIDGLDIEQIASDCGCTAEQVQAVVDHFYKAGKIDHLGYVVGWFKTNLSRDERMAFLDERLNHMSPQEKKAAFELLRIRG